MPYGCCALMSFSFRCAYEGWGTVVHDWSVAVCGCLVLVPSVAVCLHVAVAVYCVCTCASPSDMFENQLRSNITAPNPGIHVCLTPVHRARPASRVNEHCTTGGTIATWTVSPRGYTKADIYCMWAVRGSKVLTLSQRPGKHGIAPFPVLSDASEHTSKEHM